MFELAERVNTEGPLYTCSRDPGSSTVTFMSVVQKLGEGTLYGILCAQHLKAETFEKLCLSIYQQSINRID